MAENERANRGLTAEEIAAIEEFRRKPVGQHSLFLQQRINIMRSEPVEGKKILFCTKPHKEWVLAQMNGRKKPMIVHSNVVFHDIVEAEYEIFRRRWERHFGTTIPHNLLPSIESRR